MENGHILIHEGVIEAERARAGVACLVKKEKKKYIRKWENINERILLLELNRKREIETIITAYEPNNNEKQQIKEDF